jgi:Zn-dependent protease with chaperone function
MFNNIIYFIIVLLIFNMSPHEGDRSGSLSYSISMMALLWGLFAFICSVGFRRLIGFYKRGVSSGYAAMYNRLILKLSVSAIFIFNLDVFSFDLKYWIEAIPIAGNIYIFQGISSIIIFIIYLSTMWYFAHPAYNIIWGTDIRKSAFITGNIRFNIPVIFPWLLLTIVSDIIDYSSFTGLKMFLERPSGQIVFLVFFLIIIMIYIPVVIKYFWGCKPLPDSLKVEGIRNFFRELGFRYSDIVNWPLLEGKMMTAGIMGIIPGYRYIMITDSLLDILTQQELNAVMAHEAGHAKYKHQLKLSLLFLGYFIFVMGLFDSGYFFTLIGYLISKTPYHNIPEKYYLIFYAVSMVLSLVIYFRFIMGFFMRNFEREADAYAAITLNDPSPIISSLEKIAFLSGKIRDVPSWHHFSIRQRVEFLQKSSENPGVLRKHKRLVLSAYTVFIAGIVFLYAVFFIPPVKKYINNNLLSFIIKNKAKEKPGDIELMVSLATVYQEIDKQDEAKEIYEKVIKLDRKQAAARNNLAWLLLTSKNPDPADIKRGFELAKEAVKLERTPESLDTLAEGYFLMGNKEMAVRIIKEALMLDKTNPHYIKQLKKFTDSSIIGL